MRKTELTAEHAECPEKNLHNHFLGDFGILGGQTLRTADSA